MTIDTENGVRIKTDSDPTPTPERSPSGLSRAVSPSPTPTPTGPVVPVRVRTVPMPEEYGDAGMELKIWINYPNRLSDEIYGRNDESVDALFQDELQRWLDKTEVGADQDNGSRRVNGVRLRDQRRIAGQAFRDSGEWERIRNKIKDDRRKDALNKIVLEHNHWWDPEHEREYSPANTHAFWDEISNELAITIFSVIGVEITQLPNSISARR